MSKDPKPGEKKSDNHNGIIYPVIMYPFSHPKNTRHVERLYKFIGSLDSNKYARALTVLNRQTLDRIKLNSSLSREEQETVSRKFDQFVKNTISPVSDIHEVWCVDSCQMWLAGFGHTSDLNKNIGAVYWLIPGDFHYASESGEEVLNTITDIPLTAFDNPSYVDLVVGEIEVDLNTAKQLIDTYGTYGLLYNWFPSEAQAIRRLTSKPRTEFFAISDSFLKHALSRRWYAYEQTIVLLLHAHDGQEEKRGLRKILLGKIKDDETGRERLDGAMSQVERTERVLKLYWRERHQDDKNWREQFRLLDARSEKIRSAAMVIFDQILTD